MRIERVVVGVLETNCYILSINNQALVIDPGGEYHKIKRMIGCKEVVGVIVTHYHFDHIGALEHFDHSIVYDHSNLKEGINKIGPFTFEVIYTPGHKDDLISIYFKEEKSMFVGDFILNGSVGRTDLKGGNVEAMNDSINRIKTYPRDTIIYPGHDESSTLDYELQNNIYFN